MRTIGARVVQARRALPANVRTLGWVSFANDLASELAYPVVPLFLTATLGAPVSVVGAIEGVAEGISVGLRGIAGRLSDRLGARRRPWIVGGYAATTASRAVIAAATGWGWVLIGRIVDRAGKATRTAPRDALIRDSTAPPLYGASFGYHRAMDTAGAVVGPLAALALLEGGASLRTVLLVAVVPGGLTLVLLRALREAPPAACAGGDVSSRRIRELPKQFWLVVAVWALFSLGNSSDVFLILRAHELGLGFGLTVLAYATYNVVYAGLSWPLGALSDRMPRSVILAGGLAVFALVYLGFATAPGSWAIWPLFAVYGAYIAATEGVAKAWVADHAPAGAAGTAFGVFAAATGASLLFASVVAGLLWSHVSPRAPFVLGAASAGGALVLLALTKSYGMRRAPT